MTDFDYVQTASDEYSTSWKFGNRSFRRDTKLFRCKSFRYELKQLNCTKISITSRKVCSWKTFWVNILRSLSQVREPIYTSKTLKELTCMETTGNRKFERLGLALACVHTEPPKRYENVDVYLFKVPSEQSEIIEWFLVNKVAGQTFQPVENPSVAVLT